MNEITISSAGEADTVALGRALAEILPDGTVVALDGPLGAGKTRLVQAIAAATGVDPNTAVSPTFVLVQQYQGTRTIVHADAYRLQDAEEFLALGGDELLDCRGVVLIEWAERIVDCLPRERLRITIRETGVSSRDFTFTAVGPAYLKLIDRLAQWREANQR